MTNLVVCCDGTWNRRDQKHPTNVSTLFDLVAEGPEQHRYYHAGVGTKPWQKYLGGAFGVGLSQAVRDSYAFVVEHYEPGDKIFLFGFSRGAFTARSLAGLIRNAGILQPAHADRVDDAYALYRSQEGPDAPSADAFRDRYSLPGPVPIEFIGVWDTVGALGVPAIGLLRFTRLNARWSFHDVQLSSRVRHACHALGLDEKRGPFVPTLWQPQPDAPRTQTVEQVWFAGVHCDVGGGYAEHDLSDVALAWLLGRAQHCGLVTTGSVEPEPDAALGPAHESRTGIYRLVRPAIRTPGVRDPGHESLASSAARRLTSDPHYGTQPVRTWLTEAPRTTV